MIIQYLESSSVVLGHTEHLNVIMSLHDSSLLPAKRTRALFKDNRDSRKTFCMMAWACWKWNPGMYAGLANALS